MQKHCSLGTFALCYCRHLLPLSFYNRCLHTHVTCVQPLNNMMQVQTMLFDRSGKTLLAVSLLMAGTLTAAANVWGVNCINSRMLRQVGPQASELLGREVYFHSTHNMTCHAPSACRFSSCYVTQHTLTRNELPSAMGNASSLIHWHAVRALHQAFIFKHKPYNRALCIDHVKGKTI